MAKKARNNGNDTPIDITSSRFEVFQKRASDAQESIEETRNRLRRQEAEGRSSRGEKFEQARMWAAIWLLRVVVIVVGFLAIMMILAGLTNLLDETPGVLALRELFVQLVASAKSVIFILIGFFFRDYIKKVV